MLTRVDLDDKEQYPVPSAAGRQALVLLVREHVLGRTSGDLQGAHPSSARTEPPHSTHNRPLARAQHPLGEEEEEGEERAEDAPSRGLLARHLGQLRQQPERQRWRGQGRRRRGGRCRAAAAAAPAAAAAAAAASAAAAAATRTWPTAAASAPDPARRVSPLSRATQHSPPSSTAARAHARSAARCGCVRGRER
eukprot:3033115-Rhodomonas_salina.1